MTKVALVAGAGGAASKRLIDVLLADPGWSVIALARSARPSGAGSPRSAPTCSTARPARARSGRARLTHIFYTARATHGESGVESVEENVAMLRNVLDAVEPMAPASSTCIWCRARSITACTSGRFRTPAREDDPTPSAAELLLRPAGHARRAPRGRAWAWSASRPTFIYDFAPERRAMRWR